MRPEDDITAVKGVGEKTAAGFNKLGITTIDSLIRYYPRAYIQYEKPVPLRDCIVGERQAVLCRVSGYAETKKGRRHVITSVTAEDSTGSIRMVWFNMPFIRSVIRRGETYVFVGTLKIKGAMRIMEMPEYFTHFAYQKQMSVLQPVYPLTAGVTNNSLKKAIGQCEEVIDSIEDKLSDDIRGEYGLMPVSEALHNVHFPKDRDTLAEAMKRLAFDEFLEFLTGIRKLRTEAAPNTCRITEEACLRLDAFTAGLPFSLTEGQRDAIEDIRSDMLSEHAMTRLVQGDVGSGKTIVAACAMYMAVLSGYQAALLVPTEVLAEQHYSDLSKLFKPFKIDVRLLTGAMTAAEKKAVYTAIDSGECNIVIGTHALIEDKVHFDSLGLVVVDEQHRFGVRQREKLVSKGRAMPHALYMSATPIPRSLAIIIYADMDISVIKELPRGRKRIKNCVVDVSYRPSAYAFIRGEVRAGHQAYVICPMVEDSEMMDGENVIDYSEQLREALGQGIRVAYLHGKMKDAEKNEIMKSFANRETDVLVSTTVIEVGINNPNATVMMIENAERFGLSQLHQLRGRVGRGDAQSYAIFINVKKSDTATERLKCLEESNDGFYIAEQDLKLRGPGELFGVRQSGDLNFRFADIYAYSDMLHAAQEVSLRLDNI